LKIETVLRTISKLKFFVTTIVHTKENKMKMIIAAAMLASSVSFAQAEQAAPAAAAPAHAEKVAKMSKKEAKAACKSEGKKGKEMKACMKEKTM
jgi:hypothetical protein